MQEIGVANPGADFIAGQNYTTFCDETEFQFQCTIRNFNPKRYLTEKVTHVN